MSGYLIFVSILLLVFLFPIHLYLKKQGKGKSLLFYAGLFYLILGIPLIPGFLIFIGIGFCVLGILFLFLSRRLLPFPFQIILSILPVILLLSFNFYSEPSKNIFLIPKGYVGRIVIIHSCQDGSEREFEGMSRVYKIPDSGILKTKFSFAGDSFDALHSKYYYVDSFGNREEIPEDNTKIHPHGLWSLSHDRKGDTIIDFILDSLQENPYSYNSEKNEFYQKEIDSCNK